MRYWLVTVSLRLLTPLETGLLITFMIFLPQPSLPMTLFIVAANNFNNLVVNTKFSIFFLFRFQMKLHMIHSKPRISSSTNTYFFY
jgi:hypothetical protein